MPPPVPEPIHALVQYEFELGYSNDAILAGPYQVSLRTLQRMRRTWLDSGTVFVAKENCGGRPRLIDDFHGQQLLLYLEQRPMAYLDELSYFLLDEWELDVDDATVWRALHRLSWTRKASRKIARQRNQDLRNRWFSAKLPNWRAEQLIFLDESAACERTGERSLKGLPIVD